MKTQDFLGDLLVRKGLIDAAALERVRAAQHKEPVTLGRAIAALGLASEADVAAAIASTLRLDYIDTDPGVSEEARSLLPADFCRKRAVLPIAVEGNRVRLAVTDPGDYSVLQDVEFRTGKKVTAVVVTETWFERMAGSRLPETAAITGVDTLEGLQPAEGVESVGAGEYDLIDLSLLEKDTRLPPIVRLVNLILSDAAKSGASEVHIEPHETFLQVRQFVDGLLREALTIPHCLQDQTISRLKTISGMDIAERGKPQDGRSRLRFEGRRIDLRVATLPTQFGEKIVIRLD